MARKKATGHRYATTEALEAAMRPPAVQVAKAIPTRIIILFEQPAQANRVQVLMARLMALDQLDTYADTLDRALQDAIRQRDPALLDVDNAEAVVINE